MVSDEILNYCQNHTSAETPLLKLIREDTYREVHSPRMLSGHLQGAMLSMMVAMHKPKYILEIGTFTGYSAVCMANTMPDNATLITIDNDKGLEHRVRKYFAMHYKNDNIKYLIGNALDVIPNLSPHFDMVFIDADKKNYANYYDLVMPKVNKGGIIIADNVLWSGKVADNEAKDKTTQSIMNFNTHVHNDPRVYTTMLPLRDGLLIAIKQ
ncbi:MAG: O-methyltransferase [Cytophagales bacterium]|nr:O-methyltransferase [Cytophagales bacterium]